MATLREYFDTDFMLSLNIAKPLTLQSDTIPAIEIQARLHLDFDSNAKFISCFLPAQPVPLAAIIAVLKQLELILDFTKQVAVQSGFVGERARSSSELAFTGQIYFYSESDIPDEDIDRLEKEAYVNGLLVRIRGTRYAAERTKLEKPLAFICHDSRNKEDIAKPIAIGLSN